MSKQTATLFVFFLAAAFIFTACQPTSTTNEPTVTAQPTSSAQPATTDATTQSVKQMLADASYQTPAGAEQVAFTLTVDEAGVITDAQTTVQGKAPISIMRQTSFAEALPVALKGKKLSELSKIDKLGGSSLTTGAFNAALANLKSQL